MLCIVFLSYENISKCIVQFFFLVFSIFLFFLFCFVYQYWVVNTRSRVFSITLSNPKSDPSSLGYLSRALKSSKAPHPCSLRLTCTILQMLHISFSFRELINLAMSGNDWYPRPPEHPLPNRYLHKYVEPATWHHLMLTHIFARENCREGI